MLSLFIGEKAQRVLDHIVFSITILMFLTSIGLAILKIF